MGAIPWRRLLEVEDHLEFDDRSYLSQVRSLRELALLVAKEYGFRTYQLDFVNHGENATFKLKTKRKDFLLRIHCRSHRSKKAMLEELKWLDYLSKKTDLNVQKPALSKSGKLLVELECEAMGHARLCDLLEWCPGFIKEKKKPQTFFQVGRLIGQLQSNQIKTRHRNYWHAEGLIGKKATLGSLGALNKEFPRYAHRMESSRAKILRKLKSYEKKNPDKMGLIHADLHFGNMVWHKGEVTPIDFDDCGYGLLMYDLAVSLAQSSNYFKRIGKKAAREAKEQFLQGYEQSMPLSCDDREIIPYLVATRELAMLGWLYGRRDNPELYEHLKKNIGKRIRKTEKYIDQARAGKYF